MKKSISKIILQELGWLVLRTNNKKISYWEVLRCSGKVPEGNYKVTYTLDEKGEYFVYQGLTIPCIRKVRKIIKISALPNNMGLCFIPKDWIGRRVRRETVKLN